MSTELKKYDSVITAKYLLALAADKGFILNVTKVQKMLYIAYGYFLAKYNRVLIDEAPKAWPYGPVFPRTRTKVDYSSIIHLDDPELLEISKDATIKEDFNKLIDKYYKYSAAQLSEWSHEKNSPWDRTTKDEGFDWNCPIPDEYIKEYFSSIDVI